MSNIDPNEYVPEDVTDAGAWQDEISEELDEESGGFFFKIVSLITGE